MKRDSFFVIAIIVLFVLNLFTLGYVFLGISKRGPGLEHEHPPRPDKPIIDKLQLNTQQQSQFEELKKEHRRQVDSLEESSRKLHDDYFALLKADSYQPAQADSLLNLIALNQKGLDKVTFTHFEKIRNICSADQKKLFNQFIDEIAHSFKPPPPTMPPPPR